MPTVFIIAIVVLRWTVRILLVLFIADLLVGMVHWLEDSYGQVHWPVIGSSIIEPNLLHHRDPRAFLANSWWQSADIQVLGALVVSGLAAACGWLCWELIVVLVLAVNGNEVHKWAHRSKSENGCIISLLQDWGIVQSRRHHAHHHGGERNTHYCSLTSWVNPILERIRFWRGLEAVIHTCTGVSPRVDPEVIRRRERRAA